MNTFIDDTIKGLNTINPNKSVILPEEQKNIEQYFLRKRFENLINKVIEERLWQR
jgi:hypothetical protein